MLQKSPRFESKKLRDSARGQTCTFQVVGVCNHNPETSILAHINCEGGCMGGKESDYKAAIVCGSCHTWHDQNIGTEEERLFYSRRGLVRTWEYWFSNGIIGVLRK